MNSYRNFGVPSNQGLRVKVPDVCHPIHILIALHSCFICVRTSPHRIGEKIPIFLLNHKITQKLHLVCRVGQKEPVQV